MKYKPLEKAERKTAFFENLFCGSDNLLGETAKKDSCFKRAENMYVKDGYLCTRKAVCAANGFITEDAEDICLTVSDAVYYADGEKYKIGYYSDTFEGKMRLNFMLISKSGEVSEMGSLLINTTAVYKHHLILVGSPIKQNGTGIFVIVETFEYASNRYAIYEYDDVLCDFSEVNPSECYIPTVYAFGRGNGYNESLLPDKTRFGTPTHVEDENLFNHYFRCYFTTDGLSSSFDLPIKDICITETVTFVLHLSKITSITASFYRGEHQTDFFIGGVPYRANFDYANARLTFETDGHEAPIPSYFTYGSNNLEVIACNKSKWTDSSVIGSKNAVFYNSRVYYYGSESNPNTVYSAQQSNIFYVPDSSKVIIGSPSDEIIAMAPLNDKVIAFKRNEIFKININSSEALSKTINIIFGSEEFTIADTMKAESISVRTGCTRYKTLASCGGRLIWLGDDRKIYALEGTADSGEKNICCISEPINFLLEDLSEESFNTQKTFGFSCGGFYYICIGDKIYACDMRIDEYGYKERYGNFEEKKKISWYEWSFPEGLEILSGTESDGRIILSCDFNQAQFYALLRDAQRDILPLAETVEGVTEYTEKEYRINTRFETKRIDFGIAERKKIIDGIFIGAKSNGSLILEISEDDKKTKTRVFYPTDKFDVYKATTGNKNIKSLILTACGNDGMEISDIKINYRVV